MPTSNDTATQHITTEVQAALALHQAGRLAEAEQAYLRLLARHPHQPDALHLLGLCLYQRGDAAGAADLITQSVRAAPRNPVAQNNLGVAWLTACQPQKALEALHCALILQPRYADAWINHGNTLKALRRNEDALASYARADQLGNRSPQLLYNRANLFQQLGRFSEAVTDYQAALRLTPDDPMVWHNLGAAQDQLGLLSDACESYKQALKRNPSLPYTRGHLLFAKLRCGDWRDLTTLTRSLLTALDTGQPVSEPFPVLAIGSTPLQQLNASRAYAVDKFSGITPQPHPPNGTPARDHHEQRKRLRIGYFSADFHDHATAHLMAEVFEKHDREHFECTAFSWGPRTHDVWQQRIERGFEHFLDLRENSDGDIVARSRAMGVDIAVDLKGYTQHARTGIFALRAAPVQVNFLGYPGSLGASFMDYLIADPVVVPAAHQDFYDEKIAWLPDTYQPNDASKTIAPWTPSRHALGLPEDGFVFCCFSNAYKITPDVFDIWMRLLHQVAGSVLWLLECNAAAKSHLQHEARSRGVAPERLVFAPRLPLAEHLARHRASDLFLDTFHYNAHTTASDALWAGLPLLTRLGQSFPGRVAASLLTAVGLPELITPHTTAYEEMALCLSQEPARLKALRDKLARHRLTHALFDSTRFTHHLETAYAQMAERHFAGLPPSPMVVHRQPAASRELSL